jgi:NAD-dependent DNA ligase
MAMISVFIYSSKPSSKTCISPTVLWVFFLPVVSIYLLSEMITCCHSFAFTNFNSIHRLQLSNRFKRRTVTTRRIKQHSFSYPCHHHHHHHYYYYNGLHPIGKKSAAVSFHQNDKCFTISTIKSHTTSTITMTRMALFSTQLQSVDEHQEILISDDDIRLYEEFKGLSQEIQRHDDLYYNSNRALIESTTTTTNNDFPPVSCIISDDEFDALVRREDELADKYPAFLKRWQQESGMGVAATRRGRVGATVNVGITQNNINNSNSNLQEDMENATITNSLPRLKRQHLSPMLSLDNVHNEKQLNAWLRRVVKAATELYQMEDGTSTTTTTTTAAAAMSTPQEKLQPQVTIITEPKLDGVSLSLRYELDQNKQQWQLQWAATRGDGKVGQDVTAAVQQMRHIPTQLLNSASLSTSLADVKVVEVRGEVVLPTSEFQKLQAVAKEEEERRKKWEETDESTDNRLDTNAAVTSTLTSNATSMSKLHATLISFSNPRNAASGIMLRKESDMAQDQEQAKKLRSLLQFYAYDIATNSSGPLSLFSLDGTQTRQILSDWGFSVALPVVTTNLRWKAENNDTVSISEEWLQEELIETGQTNPMMHYYSELMEYRLSLDPANAGDVETTTVSKKGSKPPPKTSQTRPTLRSYHWGDYDTDGCVHKVSEATLRSYMGNSMKSPKFAIAHKFPAQAAVTHLLDVIIQVGRTGALTPVAILEPVEVGGVTIQRATLHNFGHMKAILGRPDGEDPITTCTTIPADQPVMVRRAGDVIPQLIRLLPGSSISSMAINNKPMISLEPPKSCPACGSNVVWDEIKPTLSNSSVGQVIRCGGPSLLCPPRAITSLTHAYSRDALDITGLSEARIQQLMDAGFLRYPSDIFNLNDGQWEKMADLPRWGKKLCTNLRTSTQRVASSGVSLGRFIYSLGIRHVGKHSSELVASAYGNMTSFLEEIYSVENVADHGASTAGNVSVELFPSLQNKLRVGPVIIDSLSEFAKSPELVAAAKNLSVAVAILEQGMELERSDSSQVVDSSESNSQRPWKGLRVVFTGSLVGVTRSEAQKLAKQLGAKSTPSTVSKSTDLLVFGEKGGKKLDQALSLGVTTLTGDEFVDMFKSRDLL